MLRAVSKRDLKKQGPATWGRQSRRGWQFLQDELSTPAQLKSLNGYELALFFRSLKTHIFS
jgi:hypothetical protein